MTAAEVTSPKAIALQALDRARLLTEPSLREAVDTLPGSIRHLVGYQFGWWNATGRTERVAAGKALRPTMVLLAAEAAGADATAAIPAAVAVELVHNFSLVHDDVMDGDAMRRHRPTVWKVFGIGSAILAGDAMLNLAHEVLADSGHRHATEGSRMLSAAVTELLEGQCDDLAFEQRDDVQLAECLRMARRKTGALLECGTGLGALFGDGSAIQIERLRSFGGELGLAFQFVDDVLGIWGHESRTGKPVHSDLRSRKKSLPVVAVLSSGSPAGRKLAQAYQDGRKLTDEDVAMLADLIDSAGGRDWCLTQASALLERAMASLHAAAPAARLEELRALASFVADRDR
ncbi:dimethylallyltransferase [Rhizocola hellebori]|uniref:Dimethylallyltransferase n=1 Tax=Rhizocola hellebori TaxID=1392758 RepID=A0A8J3VHR3_9ACTN|nr:polyprenyl synthetase family protein [Rhizocola hellebori]GIH06193.1 dimethylallyltransferase [Rhizocola hellebori]